VRATNFVSTQRVGIDRVGTLKMPVEVAREAPPTVRAAVLARHARNLARFGASVSQAQEAAAMSIDAEHLARVAGTPAVLAAAMHARLSCDQSAALVPRRLELATDAFRLAVEAGDDVTLMDAQLILGHEQLAGGDGAASIAALRGFATTAQRVNPGGAEYFALLHSGMWALLAGDYQRAAALIDETAALGQAQGQSLARRFEAAQRFQLARDTGRLVDLGEHLQMAASARLPELSVFAALYFCEIGRADEANELFQGLVVDGLAHIPRGLSWVWVLHLLATVCDSLGDRSAAALLYAELRAHQGKLVAIQTLPACVGPADLALGGLAALLDRPRLAASHLQRAGELARLVGSLPWQARTDVRLARLLLEQGGPTRTRRAHALLATARDAATRLGMNGLVVP
jgi:hypothetical protein